MLPAIAAAAIAAGCASAPSTPEPRPRAPTEARSAAPLPVERITRYYTDETGTVWDDRGRKYDGTP